MSWKVFCTKSVFYSLLFISLLAHNFPSQNPVTSSAPSLPAPACVSQLDVPPEPTPLPPSALHLGAWLPKQMGLRGEDSSSKSNNNPNGPSTHHRFLLVFKQKYEQQREYPADKSALNIAHKHINKTHEIAWYPALTTPPASLRAHYQTLAMNFSGTDDRTRHAYLDSQVSKQRSSFLDCIWRNV